MEKTVAIAPAALGHCQNGWVQKNWDRPEMKGKEGEGQTLRLPNRRHMTERGVRIFESCSFATPLMSASLAAVGSNAEAEGGKMRFAVSSGHRSRGYLDAVLVLVLMLVLGIRACLSSLVKRTRQRIVRRREILWLVGADDV